MDEGSVLTASREDEWSRHPVRANLLRVALAIIPVLAAIGTTYLVVQRFGQSRLGLPWLGWIATLVLVSASVSALAGRLVQRWLPLTRLLELNLLFPEVAPSRYRQALRSGPSRELQRRLTTGQSVGDFAMGKADYLLGLLVALTQHDRLTRGHSERVRAYADMIAEEMGLSRRDRQMLHWAALLHDVGKLDVPNRILSKPGRPDDHEWELLKEHPQASVKYLEPIADWLGDWGLAAREHHLRWDGKGYPATTAGTDISLAGRIVAVADAYDVMTSARSYKKPLSAAHACTELTRGAGTQFDPAVVRAFLNVGIGRIRAATGPLSALAGLSGSSSRVINFLATQASQVAQVTTTVAISAVGAVALTLSTPPEAEPVIEAAGAVNQPQPTPLASPVTDPIEPPALLPTGETPAPDPSPAPTARAASTVTPSAPAARTAAPSTPAARTAAPSITRPPSSTLTGPSALSPAAPASHTHQPTPIITLATPTADVAVPVAPGIDLGSPARRATSTPTPSNYPVVTRPPTTPIILIPTPTPTIIRPIATVGPDRPTAASTPTGQPIPAPTQTPQVPPVAAPTSTPSPSPLPTMPSIPTPTLTATRPTPTAGPTPTAVSPTLSPLPPTITLPIPIASPTPTSRPNSTPTAQPTVPATTTPTPTGQATTLPVPTGQATTTPAPSGQDGTTPVPTSQATTVPVLTPTPTAQATPTPTAQATPTPTPVVAPSGSYVAVPSSGSGTVTNPDGSTVTYIESYRVGRDGDLIGHPRRRASYTFSPSTSIRLTESITPRWSAGDAVSVAVSGPDLSRAPTVSASGVGHLGYQLQGGELIITYVVDGAATIEFDEVVTFGISVLASDADGAGVNVRYFVATPA